MDDDDVVNVLARLSRGYETYEPPTESEMEDARFIIRALRERGFFVARDAAGYIE
jgi:hypothetical protein